jgi:hypothetical protein
MSVRLVILCFLLASGCGAGAEVAEVEMPVEVSAAGLTPALTDLGYTVTVTGMRAALADLAFTVPGDGLVTTQSQALLGPGGAPDYGHPGHVSGGEITGELPGERVIDWMSDGVALGTATLLEGEYAGANFRFRRAHAGDGLEAGDPLLDHSFHVTGTARRDGVEIAFDAVLDIDDGYELVGAPFQHDVRAGDPARLRFELYTSESFSDSGSTLFDGIDFATLDPDGDGHVPIHPGDEAHNKLRRTVQSHDFYAVIAQ